MNENVWTVSQAPLFENLILNTVARQNWREVKQRILEGQWCFKQVWKQSKVSKQGGKTDDGQVLSRLG